MIDIHYMAYRLNFSFIIVSKFDSVGRLENLVCKLYSFFYQSPKLFSKYQKISKGITIANKLLKDVDTKWISLWGPIERVFSKYKSLIRLTYEQWESVDNSSKNLHRLSDVEKLLTLASIIPLLNEINKLIKVAQENTLCIQEYTSLHWRLIMTFDNMYLSEENFIKE